MVTLSLPWYDPNLYSQELFQLIFTTKYPPLPEGTDPYLKYLISIMLKKDPKRSAIFFVLSNIYRNVLAYAIIIIIE